MPACLPSSLSPNPPQHTTTQTSAAGARAVPSALRLSCILACPLLNGIVSSHYRPQPHPLSLRRRAAGPGADHPSTRARSTGQVPAGQPPDHRVRRRCCRSKRICTRRARSNRFARAGPARGSWPAALSPLPSAPLPQGRKGGGERDFTFRASFAETGGQPGRLTWPARCREEREQ